MGRWRPPPERSTALITREGFERLRAELDELWRRRRPEVVRALSDAAAEGDRSENAEYIYRKRQLAEIDRRVRYLRRRLDELRVVDDSTPGAQRDATRVYFGAWCEIEWVARGETRRYRIVGPDEIDAAQGWISIDSPLARAALGRRVDEEIEAELPEGRARAVIIAVAYDPPDQAG